MGQSSMSLTHQTRVVCFALPVSPLALLDQMKERKEGMRDERERDRWGQGVGSG